MVRQLELWAQLHVWSKQGAQAWSGRQQVHLVRIDGERCGLSLFPDTPPREVTVALRFCAAGRNMVYYTP